MGIGLNPLGGIAVKLFPNHLKLIVQTTGAGGDIGRLFLHQNDQPASCCLRVAQHGWVDRAKQCCETKSKEDCIDSQG